MKKNAIVWIGDVPEIDDFGWPIQDEFIDGATRKGPWAIMSPVAHHIEGVGLGIGKGQRFVRDMRGRWVKVEG